MNLLEETIEVLAENGKTPEDVRWVGSLDGAYAMGWGAFAAIADLEYCEGYGTQEIANDLVVVGDDWWLERSEYDGSEWWSFKSRPLRNRWRAFVSVKAKIGFDNLASEHAREG